MAPFSQISVRAVPPALREALIDIFAGIGEIGEKVWLVGGTALAGFYAEHRRSDDIDLFAADSIAHQTAIRSVKSLKDDGALLADERTSPTYYHALVKFHDHQFTVDVVHDEFLHRIGKGVKTADGIWVADINTLLTTKISTLVSRASEKDLFDLDWLLGKLGDYKIGDLIETGKIIEGGFNIESLLISLEGARLRKEACHFLLPQSEITVDEAYKRIESLRKNLIQKLLAYEKTLPPSEQVSGIRQALKDFKKLK
ncbi:MAG: nucleotidyl transferase AbiEii/AbiGii toxin family protein [Deltaproteobacteria bacterium]|nr:nucleotidyl transferase AbiEii/AbiGii toxin family protein [Deltaproteobacteria bacterium]